MCVCGRDRRRRLSAFPVGRRTDVRRSSTSLTLWTERIFLPPHPFLLLLFSSLFFFPRSLSLSLSVSRNARRFGNRNSFFSLSLFFLFFSFLFGCRCHQTAAGVQAKKGTEEDRKKNGKKEEEEEEEEEEKEEEIEGAALWNHRNMTFRRAIGEVVGWGGVVDPHLLPLLTSTD